MNPNANRDLDEFRKKEAGPIENAVIDDFVHGQIDRRDFIRRASYVGLSAAFLTRIGALPRLHETPRASSPASRAVAASSKRLRVGIIPPPSGALEPYTLDQVGQIQMCSIGGEYLARATQTSYLKPELALSWKPNHNGTIWTFKLRPGVKFQNGHTMNADDVVTSWKRLAGPGSAAASAVGAYLTPAGVRKVDNMTVAFHLESPVSNFPYLVGSSTYSSIILPASYVVGSYATTPQASGAFKLDSYTPAVGATFNRYGGWWGGAAPLAGVDVTFYTDTAAADAALLGNTVDLLGQVNWSTDRAVFNDPNLQILIAPGPNFRSVPIRVDLKNPMSDPRVRQAFAYCLNRPAIAKTLWGTDAIIGNDSPFHPIYGLIPNSSVPQRSKNIRKAKQLMQAAGYGKGFSITLTTEQYQEIPDYAQILKQSAKQIGIDLKLDIISVDQYFAGSQTGPPKGWGDTPWLNGAVTITNWGSRPVPDTLLTAPLESKGVWNASHWSNKTFDSHIKAYLASPSFSDQQKDAVAMQKILLADTPEIISYFYGFSSAAGKAVKGFKADQIGLLYLSRTSLT